MKKTRLYEDHLKLGAKMMPFAGYLMPVQYSKGIRMEHHCVRNHVGLFDVSHMGELRVQGEGAYSSLQWMTSNNVDRLEPGQAQYSLLLNFQGGIVDDVLIYCIEKNTDYLVCVNAINKDKAMQWMLQNQKRQTHIKDESDDWSQIAVQGPKALKLAELTFGTGILSLASFRFLSLEGSYVARTGYTGEDGVEIFVRNDLAVELWRELLEKGQDFQVSPIGLGARDCLRIEMKYSLYGHEIDEQTNPIEAGLAWTVKFKKGDFIARDKLLKIKQEGPSRQLIGFKILDKGGLPRQGYPIHDCENNEVVGHVTSGTLSPTAGIPIGIGYVSSHLANVGQTIQVAIRKHLVKAEVVKTPFIK